MFRVAAENICRMQYSPTRKLLEVQFHKEEVIYQYLDVPEDVWYTMRNCASIDLYFNTKVATCYRVRCVRKHKKKDWM